MKGKLIHTLKMQTTNLASVGSPRKFTSPNPNALSAIGIGLCGAPTSQFQEVAETTTGTIHGSSSSTLKSPPAGMRVRSSSESARPTSHDPNTPTTVKMIVKIV